MTILRKLLVALAVFLVLVGGFAFWVYRGTSAELAVEDVTGTDPTLSEAKAEMFPTVRIAKPVGWKDGELPDAADGLAVMRFAEGLEHPRVIHTLPNGDVLVTLTRAPKSGDGGGITGWIADKLMTRAGAKGDSPNQLVLLRDDDGDGAAEVRRVLTDALDSPSGI
ncbi:MAG: sorbosone dehydrogenase family protein, partial [Sphingomonadaceae bacterium]|nr:sorbosone dehydrogenase family protein [Sphingomonadaceae bacterium]